VTDGEYNASLRGDQTPENLTIEQASEMLAEKRAKGPAEPRKRTTKTVKAAASKETPAKAVKKAAPKKAAKKAAPKKAAKKAAPKES
jgi:DNA topoisomerase-1